MTKIEEMKKDITSFNEVINNFIDEMKKKYEFQYPIGFHLHVDSGDYKLGHMMDVKDFTRLSEIE